MTHAYHRLKFLLFCMWIVFCSLELSGQQARVTGTITDQFNGEAIIGASVHIKGTTTGTVSDLSGQYRLDATTGNVLVYSFVGYVVQEVEFTGQPVINIALVPDIQKLDEIVVIGYGVQKKDDLTGSVTVVNVEEMSRANAVSFDKAIQGRAAGVHVTNTSGRPGAGVSIKIRGIGSISRSSEPLYVVDGIPISEAGINSINPADIESLQVLKDASATAIYGTRGANGVVMITTKRGKSGTPKVNFSSNFTSSVIPRKFEVMNADQYSELMGSAWANYAERYKIADDKNLYLTVYSKEARAARNNEGTSTDFQDEMTRRGNGQNYNLGVSGGGENSNYFISANYFKESGIMINTGMERFSIRANSDFQLGNRVKIGESITISRVDYNYDSHKTNFNSWYVATIASPLMPLLDPTAPGGYGGPTDTLTGGNERTNPIAEQMLNQNTEMQNRVIANSYVDVKIIKGLKYSLKLGGEFNSNHTRQWSPKYTLGNLKLRDNDISSLGESAGFGNVVQIGNFLEYQESFGDHQVVALVGHERTRNFGNGIYSFGRNIPFEDLSVLKQVTTGERVGGDKSDDKLESVLGRFMYDYKGRYLVTASIRRDGSSMFGPLRRIGYFPSFSVGWKLNEDFLKGVEQINMLKIRLGWGQTGNSNIPPYQYLELIDPFVNSRYTFGRNQDLWLGGAPTSFQANPLIQWEAAEMTNFGVDLNAYGNKVLFTAEYYIKNQDQMLVSKPISVVFGKRVSWGSGGAPTVGAWMNLAQIQNRGLELNLTYRELQGAFTYSVNANFSTLKNRIIELGVSEFATTYNYAKVGSTIGSFYGFVADGILQVEDFEQDANGNLIVDGSGGYKIIGAKQEARTSPGDIRFKDLNSDGVINDLDRTIIGKPLPDFIYGASFECGYRGIDLSIFFQGMQNMDVYNQHYSSIGIATDANGKDENKLVDVMKYWTPENRSNTMTRVNVVDENRNNRISSWFLEDASFLRLKTIQVGYTLPSYLSERASIQRLRIYVGGNNLYTITGYKGYDPEVGSRNPLGAGVDGGTYPQPKTYMAGVQIDF